MARYHGKQAIAYMSTTGGGVAGNVLSLTGWTLDLSTDKVEVTALGDPNKTYVQGLKDVKGTLAGVWDNADTTLFVGADSPDGVKLYLYPSSLVPTAYWYGPAWLDMSIADGVGAAVTISGNFVANGAWGRKP